MKTTLHLLPPLKKARPQINFSRSDVAGELDRAIDLIVYSLGADDIEELVMNPHTTLVQLQFLRMVAANFRMLAVMLERARRARGQA